MISDPIECEVARVIETALRTVRLHRPAEVTVVVSSDRTGAVYVRVRGWDVPLETLILRDVR